MKKLINEIVTIANSKTPLKIYINRRNDFVSIYFAESKRDGIIIDLSCNFLINDITSKVTKLDKCTETLKELCFSLITEDCELNKITIKEQLEIIKIVTNLDEIEFISTIS